MEIVYDKQSIYITFTAFKFVSLSTFDFAYFSTNTFY